MLANKFISQGLHSQIFMMGEEGGGGGGSDRGSYFIPKKSQLQDLPTQKIHYFC